MAEKTVWGTVGASKVTMTWDDDSFQLPSKVDNLYPKDEVPRNARAFYCADDFKESIAFALNAVHFYFKDTPYEELLSGNVSISVEPHRSPLHTEAAKFDNKRTRYHLGMINELPYLVCEDLKFMSVPLGKGNHFSDELMLCSVFERAFASVSVDALQEKVLVTDFLACGRAIASSDITSALSESARLMVASGWYERDGLFLVKPPSTRYAWESE